MLVPHKPYQQRLQEERTYIRQALHDSDSIRRLIGLMLEGIIDSGFAPQADRTLEAQTARFDQLVSLYRYLDPANLRAMDLSLMEDIQELEKDA